MARHTDSGPHLPDTLSRLRAYRYPSMALAAGLLLAVGVAMVWGIAELKREISWVDHSYRVISEIDGGQVALLKSESAARGYRRTGAAAQQADYLLIVPQVLDHLDNLVRLTGDNPEQNERARRWRDLVHTRLGELERLMDDTQVTGTVDEAINRDVRFSRMRRTSTLANDMRTVERKLLVQRRATTDQRATQLTMFVVLGTAIPVVLLGLLLTGLLRENGRARKLEREARSAMREPVSPPSRPTATPRRNCWRRPTVPSTRPRHGAATGWSAPDCLPNRKTWRL